MSYPVAYFLTALLALVNSSLSLVFYAAISLFYLLPGIIDRQLTNFESQLNRESFAEKHET